MSKYDDAKKGARFTMCQAALQGGADISIVPKIMDYIETGDADALRYLSPCESLEKEVGNRTAMYQELQIKNDELKSALVDLREEYEKIQIEYRTLLKDAYKFQSEMRAEKAKLYNAVPEGSAITISTLVTRLAGLQVPTNKRTYVQVGEYLMAVSAVKVEHDKPIIVVGGQDGTNPSSIYKILPDRTLEHIRGFECKFDEIHDQLGKKMIHIREIDKSYEGFPERFSDGKRVISVSI